MSQSASDSVRHLVRTATPVKHEPPGDLPKLTVKERRAWVAYLQARTDWRESDLRVLHQAIKLETRWLKADKAASREPLTVETSNGPKAHPIHSEARAALRDWQSALRFLGLNQPKPNAMRAGARGAPAGSNRGKRNTSLLAI